MSENPYRTRIHGWVSAADVWDEGFAAGQAAAEADAARLARALQRSLPFGAHVTEWQDALAAHRERVGGDDDA